MNTTEKVRRRAEHATAMLVTLVHTMRELNEHAKVSGGSYRICIKADAELQAADALIEDRQKMHEESAGGRPAPKD